MNNAKLQFWVSITQVISSLAVVISIVYLVTEYNRQNTLNNRYVENFVYDRMTELDRLVIENPDMAGIIQRAQAGADSLSVIEKARYLAYEHIFYDTWEALWVNHMDGIVDEPTWKGWNEWFVEEAGRRPAFGWVDNLENYPGGDDSFREHLIQSLSAEREQQ